MRLTFLIVLLVAYSGLAYGQTTLFEQEPIVVGNPDTRFVAFASTNPPDAEEEIPNRTYDNFSLEVDADITGLKWRGSYDGAFNADQSLRSDVDFEIEIFGNAAGNSPNINQSIFMTVLDGGTAGNDNGSGVSKSVIPNQLTRKGTAILEYEAALPTVELSAGDYWLSIRAKLDFPSGDQFQDPGWSWVMSQDGDSLVYNFDDEFDPAEPGTRFTQALCDGFGLAGCDVAFTLSGATDANGSGILGDFDNNKVLEAADIDLLSAEIRNASTDTSFDLTGDGKIDLDDHTFWVEDIFGTLFGDADLNKTVAFADFLALSDNFGGSAGWSGGDFNADGNVRFADFLFVARNFALTATAESTQMVPEPTNMISGFVLLLAWTFRKGRRR